MNYDKYFIVPIPIILIILLIFSFYLKYHINTSTIITTGC